MSVTPSTAGRCRVQMHRLINLNAGKELRHFFIRMRHIFFYFLLFVLYRVVIFDLIMRALDYQVNLMDRAR